MKRSFFGTLASKLKPTAARSRHRSVALAVEALEGRELLTTADFFPNGDLSSSFNLKIHGDANSNNIVITQTDGAVTIMDNNVRVMVQQRDPLGTAIGDPSTDRIRIPTNQQWSISVEAGDGNDRVDVISFFDLYHYNNVSKSDQNVFASINGGAGDDTLTGGPLHDTLMGGDANDLLFGQTGSDVVDGGAGDDLIYGGEGDDQIQGGIGNDTIEGGTGSDLVRGGGDNDFLLADTWYPTDFTGNDTLQGEDGNDSLYGGAGNDFLYGGPGADSLFGGAGNDLVQGDGVQGDDFWSQSDASMCGNDSLYGGVGNDSIFGGAGDDLIHGDDGDDVVMGDAGIDRVYGDAGSDFVYGGNQYDYVYNPSQGALVYGTDNDFLSGGAGNDRLWGGFGNDVLDGGSGADALDGGHGSDVIYFNFSDRDTRSYDTLDRLIQPAIALYRPS